MTQPLEVLGASQRPKESWEQFPVRRAALEAELELGVCDGCDECGTRCISGFGVREAEWRAVREYWSGLPLEERRRLESQRRTLPWPGAEELGVEAEVTYCRFRDMERGACSIYPVRPTICRLFGLVDWLPCPIGAVERYPETAFAFWNDYRQEKEKTWEQWQEEEIVSSLSNR